MLEASNPVIEPHTKRDSCHCCPELKIQVQDAEERGSSGRPGRWKRMKFLRGSPLLSTRPVPISEDIVLRFGEQSASEAQIPL
jgi:hypothetical protein